MNLLNALIATGKPVVVLLFNGRPLSDQLVAQNVPAILECWNLGQEAAEARWRTFCSGIINPSGKLPISTPRSVGHLPVYYNHKPSARRGYLLGGGFPIFSLRLWAELHQFTFGNPRRRPKENLTCRFNQRSWR